MASYGHPLDETLVDLGLAELNSAELEVEESVKSVKNI